ncbi:MAG: AAA family ATPase, partial [Methanomicrobiales archaeon]|nr:AAA family ATPase [Methanomicrobiales archaeon]
MAKEKRGNLKNDPEYQGGLVMDVGAIPGGSGGGSQENTADNQARAVISADESDGIVRFHEVIREALGSLIIGNEQLIEHILTALLSGGHILIEGSPGTAKTSIAKAIAHLTSCEFSRVQAAVDIQPADIIGVNIFNQNTRQFEFKKGPVFTNILMIDEINRLSPKTQSAFIEAMSERQVTVDGVTTPLASPFFVIATQNPYEFEGTFPLIEVQRDRFMFCHKSNFMDAENELRIITSADEGRLDYTRFQESQKPVMSVSDILYYRERIHHVYLGDQVKRYIRDIILATRSHSDIHLGASSRASLAFVRGGKAVAA